uniref:Uncharacterized protein n=1 Tax=Kalanchoe fedtschenkoi TaxID=63787 RepID=A0A7N0T8Y5_KALFE
MESQIEKVGSSRGRSTTTTPTSDRDFVLQWGNRKRLRCVKLKKSNPVLFNANRPSPATAAAAPVSTDAHPHHSAARRYPSPMKNGQSTAKSASSSPEKEDRYYTTRGSVGGLDDYGKFLIMEGGGGVGGAREEKTCGGTHVWPKLFVSLSSKEKEEDFMAMKGCKLPQRPKKRAKLVQRSVLVR